MVQKHSLLVQRLRLSGWCWASTQVEFEIWAWDHQLLSQPLPLETSVVRPSFRFRWFWLSETDLQLKKLSLIGNHQNTGLRSSYHSTSNCLLWIGYKWPSSQTSNYFPANSSFWSLVSIILTISSSWILWFQSPEPEYSISCASSLLSKNMTTQMTTFLLDWRWNHCRYYTIHITETSQGRKCSMK